MSGEVEQAWRVNPDTPTVIITPYGRISINWSVQRPGDETDYTLAEQTAAAIVEAMNDRQQLEAGREGVNCFGIPDRYKGWVIKQGPDDRFYADAPSDGATWEELRDEIDFWESRNAR